jgi:hypothetical protein
MCVPTPTHDRVCNTVETIIVYLVSCLSKTFKSNVTNHVPRESPSQSRPPVDLALHANRMRADRSEAACKRHRHHEKLSKNAASFVSPLNTSAPALFSSASSFSDRPSARTLSPALSKPSVMFLPVLPVAPMIVTRPVPMRVKILLSIFKVTPTQQFADVRRIDFRPRFANCALPSRAGASKEIIVPRSAQ